ncbi:MAG: hypothetical protein EXR62_10735 [Chloroflexi bacterium]|nr:hypothetical protein [Chloroflexota bacterium]
MVPNWLGGVRVGVIVGGAVPVGVAVAVGVVVGVVVPWVAVALGVFVGVGVGGGNSTWIWLLLVVNGIALLFVSCSKILLKSNGVMPGFNGRKWMVASTPDPTDPETVPVVKAPMLTWPGE